MPFILLPESNPASSVGPAVIARVVATAADPALPPIGWPKGYEQAVVVQLPNGDLEVHPVVGGDLDRIRTGPYASLGEVAAAVTAHTGQACQPMATSAPP